MKSRSEREGVNEFVMTAGTKALVIKGVTMGEGGVKIIQNCVTSFMDDPLARHSKLLACPSLI